jgi:hypothetical protein
MGGTEVGMAADGARAETYLRLMVEAELRRALSLPRYQPPRPPGLPAPVRAMLHPISWLARTASTAIAARCEPAQAMQSSAGRAAMRAVTVADWKIRALAATAQPTTDSVLPKMARSTWQIRWRSRRARRAVGGVLPGRRSAGPPAAMSSVQRVRQVASALVAADTITVTAAESAVQSLSDALLARAKIDESWPDGPWRPASPAPGLPTGPVRAVPVGASVLLGPGGSVGHGWLLTLVLDPDRASLTAAGRLTGVDTDDPPWTRRPPRSPFNELDRLTAADDHGAAYQVRASHGGWGGTTWSRMFDVSPLPPPGIRWLDITMPSRTPIRVDLASAGPSPPQVRPAQVPGELGTAGGCCAADRVLDAWSVHLLGHAARTGQAGPELLSGLAEVAGALRALGVLRADCAALGRLATLSGHLHLSFPASLRASTRLAGLPEAWTSVLTGWRMVDGLDRAAPVAAVLPAVDGARFALAGLRSATDSATLQVLTRGWHPDHLQPPCGTRYSWWARDNAGRWHLATEGAHGYHGGQGDLELRFRPPIHPRATALDIFVIGPASATGVTVPLDWQAAQ